ALLEQLFGVGSQPVSPLYLLGQRLPDLGDELQHFTGIDHGRVSDGNPRRLLHHLLQLVQKQQQIDPVHRPAPPFACRRPRARGLTFSATHASTGPPTTASSFTRLGRTWAYAGLVGKSSVSVPGDSARFMPAICSSYSQSVGLRTPRTMTAAPRLLA